MTHINHMFKLVGFILLFTNLIIVIFISQTHSDFQCPNCHSKDFTDYGDTIECNNCGYEFPKASLGGKIDKENIISEQERKAFARSFIKDFKDEDHMKKVFESIDKDLQELQEEDE